MKRAVSLAVCAVGVLGSLSSAGHLRAQTGATGGDAPTGPKSVVTPECDPFQKNPCVQHKFVTPEIMEEKAYDEKSGLFIEHKLSTQEASELKATVEKGVEEVKEGVKEEKVQRPASDAKGSATGEAVENGEMEGEGETSPLLKEAEKEQKELALKGLGKYEEFISQNKQVLKKHNVHRTIVNRRAEKTSKMVEALKAELEEVKAKEAKLKQEHASITKHTQIARLMAEKKSLDSEIQRHADKLKVLDSEQEQLRKEQVRHINKIDAMKEKLDSLHREILRYKKELGIGESAEVSTVDKEEAEVEEAAVSSADEAKKNAGKKALEEAKEEEEEEEEEEENTQATGGATGSATGVALPSNTAGKKGVKSIKEKASTTKKKKEEPEPYEDATGGDAGAATGSSTGNVGNSGSTGTETEESSVAAGLEKKIAQEEAKLKALEA